ncbi:hypothetical protein F2Q69_00031000 [Brassica cretica]|uniref:Ubiquitin-like protease family profile domain-containing protein n=1 Tax=Brassica cretica TaxID=69181 RepID=A0A8S9RXJ4_BRACR|nr:hypothetical protein F2Q69_00031000 [Brassica cretica]
MTSSRELQYLEYTYRNNRPTTGLLNSIFMTTVNTAARSLVSVATTASTPELASRRWSASDHLSFASGLLTAAAENALVTASAPSSSSTALVKYSGSADLGTMVCDGVDVPSVNSLGRALCHHIDAWINVLRKRYDANPQHFRSESICFLDHLFAQQWIFNFKDFKDSKPDHNGLGRRLTGGAWNYYAGTIPSFCQSNKVWGTDINDIYAPVNFADSHWIAMWISIPKRHIVVFDSICSSISPEELDVVMELFLYMVPYLLVECASSDKVRAQYSLEPFTKDFAKPNGKSMRDKMAVDLFQELPNVHEFKNKDMDDILGTRLTHIDAWINVLRKRYNANPQHFRSERMCFLDHLFAQQWRFNFKDFKDSKPDQNGLGRRLPGGAWNYYAGTIPSFCQSNKVWGTNIDDIYSPVNFADSHWIAMWISIPKRHIVVFDSLCSSISPDELDVVMEPFLYMVPYLLVECASSDEVRAQYSLEPFTYERLTNIHPARAGDCGVYTLKYIECHALEIEFSKKDFAKPNGKSMRDKMSVGIFQELPDVHEFENKDMDDIMGTYDG